MKRATLSVAVSVEVTCLMTRGLSSKRRAGRKHAFQAHSSKKSYLGEVCCLGFSPKAYLLSSQIVGISYKPRIFTESISVV